MSNVYRMESTGDSDPTGTPFYDVTKNGQTLLARVRYTEAFEHVASLIEDDDRYQEVRSNGTIYSDEDGAAMKKSHQRGYGH
jgi:hypothetical protein